MSDTLGVCIIGTDGKKAYPTVGGLPSGKSDGRYKLVMSDELGTPITVTEQAEGKIDLDLPSNGFMLHYLLVKSDSANFDIRIFLDDAHEYEIVTEAGNNAKLTKIFDPKQPYYDLDETSKLHLQCDDVAGADTFDIVVIGSVA